MQGGDGENLGLGKRVPSFYTSPSLVNLSGLGVADQPLLTSNSGGNMRLRNDSGSDLADGGAMTMDSGSEDGRPAPPSSPKSIHSAPDTSEEPYTKTTSMAAFYYRKNRSSDQLSKSEDSLPEDFRSKYE